MTEAEEHALYLLRKHFQIPATDALYVLPSWEVDLLMTGLFEEFGRHREAVDEPASRQSIAGSSRGVDPASLAKELERGS